MRTTTNILAVGTLLALIMTLYPTGDAAAAEQSRRVLRHVVMYKFKDDLAPGELQKVVDTFAALPAKIHSIIGFEHGANVSQEGKSEGLTHAFVVTFADEQGRDEYLKHPAHLEYVKVASPRREKVIVFDYWADE
jgi:hypothetical protein